MKKNKTQFCRRCAKFKIIDGCKIDNPKYYSCSLMDLSDEDIEKKLKDDEQNAIRQ